MGKSENRYARLKERARRSSTNIEDRSGGDKKKYFFLDTDPSIVGDKPIEFYKPKFTTGRAKNIIDILPYPISCEWYKDLLAYNKNKVGLSVENEDLDYKLEVPVHTIGKKGEKKQFLCLREALGQKCPICEEMFEVYGRDNRTTEDKDYANSLQPRWRVFYNIFDYAEPDKGIQLMEMAFGNFEKFLIQSAGLSNDGIDDITDSDPIFFFDLEEGMSLKFSGVKDSFSGQEYVKVTSFDFEDRSEQYQETVIDETYPLDKMLPIPTYSEVKSAFVNQYEDDDTDDTDESSQNSPPNSEEGATNPSSELTCPEGGTFGKDCNEFSECKDCDQLLFDECSSAQIAAKEADKPVARTRSFGARV